MIIPYFCTTPPCAVPIAGPIPSTPKRLAKCNMNSFPLSILLSFAQPHPPKQQYHSSEEPQPRLPPHPRLLRHPQHPIHCTPKPIPRILKLVVHFLREGGRVADFVADEVCKLEGVVSECPFHESRVEREREREGVHLSTASPSPSKSPHAHSHADSPAHLVPQMSTGPGNSVSRSSYRHHHSPLDHILHHCHSHTDSHSPQDTKSRYSKTPGTRQSLRLGSAQRSRSRLRRRVSVVFALIWRARRCGCRN